MKKIKTISVRVSSEAYAMLKSDYQYYKNNPEWIKLIHKVKVKTFSDYLRLMLEIGYND